MTVGGGRQKIRASTKLRFANNKKRVNCEGTHKKSVGEREQGTEEQRESFFSKKGGRNRRPEDRRAARSLRRGKQVKGRDFILETGSNGKSPRKGGKSGGKTKKKGAE